MLTLCSLLDREAFSILQEAGCSDEALCYEMYVVLQVIDIAYTHPLNSRWMSKEPAEIFERAAEEGFITQVSCPFFYQVILVLSSPIA